MQKIIAFEPQITSFNAYLVVKSWQILHSNPRVSQKSSSLTKSSCLILQMSTFHWCFTRSDAGQGRRLAELHVVAQADVRLSSALQLHRRRQSLLVDDVGKNMGKKHHLMTNLYDHLKKHHHFFSNIGLFGMRILDDLIYSTSNRGIMGMIIVEFGW